MKVRTSLLRLCTFCIFVNRKRKKYIFCSKNLKHKQRQK